MQSHKVLNQSNSCGAENGMKFQWKGEWKRKVLLCALAICNVRMLENRVFFFKKPMPLPLFDELLSNTLLFEWFSLGPLFGSPFRICCVVFVCNRIHNGAKENFHLQRGFNNEFTMNGKPSVESFSFLWLPITFYSHGSRFAHQIHLLLTRVHFGFVPSIAQSSNSARHTMNGARKKKPAKDICVDHEKERRLHSNYLCWFKLKTQ